MTNPSRGELVPGGLAMVIGGSNIGAIVELVYGIQPGAIYSGPDGRIYRLGIGRPAGFLVRGDGFVSEIFGGNEGFKMAKDLMPINPEPDPLEITQHQEQST